MRLPAQVGLLMGLICAKYVRAESTERVSDSTLLLDVTLPVTASEFRRFFWDDERFYHSYLKRTGEWFFNKVV